MEENFTSSDTDAVYYIKSHKSVICDLKEIRNACMLMRVYMCVRVYARIRKYECKSIIMLKCESVII